MEIKNFLKKNNWISVNKKLPKTDNKSSHDFDVLCYVPKRKDCHQHGIYIGKLKKVKSDEKGERNIWGIRTEECDWTLWGWSYFEHPIVTHWMPLPSKPKEE